MKIDGLALDLALCTSSCNILYVKIQQLVSDAAGGGHTLFLTVLDSNCSIYNTLPHQPEMSASLSLLAIIVLH